MTSCTVSQVSRDLLYAIALNVGLVLVGAGLVVLVVLAIRYERRRRAGNTTGAADYGLSRPTRVLARPWIRHLPDQGKGYFNQFFTGQRSGRPVAVAEYSWYKTTSGQPILQHSAVAAVQLPAAGPPRQGSCRYGDWFTDGPDLVIVVHTELQFPWIIGALDELLGVANWLTS